ncbi:SpoIIAA family protein [Shewanella cyperi]|uniref:STAS/SEC14 domain-containing protein n=1 Tax=Shewanella cyperi TaxID=2814292 RepID=A0A975AKF4_9GAMM|nr:STAS/SEC14 domain-containing protein [Shewanella cyperi]QSX29297.1 STAS/SEC14 domain-containing protein [Shewanella cyperi]QSX40047.1 STAS/SEC14 domain-containing protein [Shewanella cyperi]
MKVTRHGISIGVERHGDDDFFVVMKVVGKLTHEDYEQMVPVLETAIAGVKDPALYVIMDATELEGWEPRALWDDLKLGLRHGRHFEKIAIVGEPGWQEWLARIGNWFTAGEVKFFVDYQDGVDWLGD